METESDWQSKCQNLSQRISTMFKYGQWTDCTFLVGSESDQEVIGAHKNILASASQVFAAMFYGEMAERQSPIPIPDIRPEAFRAMLEHIYDEVDFEKKYSVNTVCNLYYAADKYNLKFIKEVCVKYMDLYLDENFDHVCQIYEYALLYGEKTLITRCLQIMSINTHKVLMGSGFTEAEVSTVVTIFSLEAVFVYEVALFTALERYLKAQKVIMDSIVQSHSTERSSKQEQGVESTAKCDDNSGPLEDITAVKAESDAESGGTQSNGDRPTVPEEKSITRVLLEKIRFLTMEAEEFALGPAVSGLLTESETLAILTNIVTLQSPILMPRGFCTSREKRDLSY